MKSARSPWDDPLARIEWLAAALNLPDEQFREAAKRAILDLGAKLDNDAMDKLASTDLVPTHHHAGELLGIDWSHLYLIPAPLLGDICRALEQCVVDSQFSTHAAFLVIRLKRYGLWETTR